METTMLCPQCLSPLDSQIQGSARCSVHGNFRVLFSRADAAAPQVIQAISQSSAATYSDATQQRELAPALPSVAVAQATAELELQPVRETSPEEARALAALGLAEKPKPKPLSPGPQRTAPEGKCVRHPKMDSVQNCTQCQTPMCRMCLYRAPYGKKICPSCSGLGGAAPADGGVSVSSPDVIEPRSVSPMMVGISCATHADVQAIHKCKICSAGVCETCDFKFPGSIHICPVCVMKPRGGLSARRLKFVIWGYAVGAVTFLSYAMGEYYASSGFMILSLVTCVVGLPLSLAPLEKKLPNTNALWIGLVLNALFMLIRLAILVMVIMSH